MSSHELDFIVIGMPRSGTSWLANLLTTDRSLCMHDPFAQAMPDQWERDTRKFGISCTLSFVVKGWLEQFDCPVAIIERDESARNASLLKMGLAPNPKDPVSGAAFANVKGLRFDFDALWDEGDALKLLEHLLPDIPFDSLRYRQLLRLQVQPHMQHWTADLSVFKTLNERGLLTMGGC